MDYIPNERLHTDYPAALRNVSMAELHYMRHDLHEVVRVQEQGTRDGHHFPKLPRYVDELHYVCMELRRRQSN